MTLNIYSEKIYFSGITVSSDGTASQSISHEFNTDIKAGDIVLKAFKITYGNSDHWFETGLAEISNVSFNNSTIEGEITLGLRDNDGGDALHGLDTDGSFATVTYIVDCE